MSSKPARKGENVVAFIIFLVILIAGLLLGTQSTLILERSASGAVSATNAWRLNGALTLIKRSVSNLGEARMAEVSLTSAERRSTAHRDAFGMLQREEALELVGDNVVAYPYQEDLSLIRGFLGNRERSQLVITHPVDIRRSVSSWVLLALAATSVIGWIVKRMLGRDPLADMPDKVKPLPGNRGAYLLLAVVAVVAAFYALGDKYFGALATRKVDLLMDSARSGDAAGTERAIREGVFVDVRDGQDTTALMFAARAGAGGVLDALLRAGALVDARNVGGSSALDLAIGNRHSDLALKLIEAGADLHAGDDNGRTPLMLAASEGAVPVLQRLLAGGAEVKARDRQGWTALMNATLAGCAACVGALMDAGADPAVALGDGRKALDMAADDAVRRLLSPHP